MGSVVYPTAQDFKNFVQIVQSGEYKIKKYLPSVSEEWFVYIAECIEYVQMTEKYEVSTDFHNICARILYKVAKKHELTDANKRTSVIAVYLFCLLNDYWITSPQELKNQARRIASSKGRNNEALMEKRVAMILREIIVKG